MKSVRILPVLMSLLLLAGCTMPSGDELLAAPKPPGNYQTLQTKLEELLASGVSYTTPTTGENRSSVQLVDLDGDGHSVLPRRDLGDEQRLQGIYLQEKRG